MERITDHLPDLSTFRSVLCAGHAEDQQLTEDFENYRKFLFLIFKYPHTSAVPTKRIDWIWHRHLDNLTNYTNDCLDYFGRLIIHNECKNVSDVPGLERKFEVTGELWRLNFKSVYGEKIDMAFCGFDGDDGADSPDD